MTVHSLVLPTLKSPRDLAALAPSQLKLLAAEIRDELCRLSDQRAVHFASNMGVVELTIALHAAFDFSKDRLIWDTGHQCYPHKLLTGRFRQFDTIRTKGGLMGFPNPAESAYDLMMTGHAGCSVGTALGLTCGDELVCPTEERHSVAVIGDGAFASGPVFEAMGHAGWLRKNITVVLNDNKMSICPRVGGISSYLDRLRMARTYLGFKHRIRHIVRNLPYVNKFAERFLGSFKSAVKAAFLGGMLFEELGFRYIGPVDGHDILQLQQYFRLVRKYEEPVLLHVFTEKGRGFEPAEENPTVFHAPSPGMVGRNSRHGDLKNQYALFSDPYGRNDPHPNGNGNTANGVYFNEHHGGLEESSHHAPTVPGDISFTQHVREAVMDVMRKDPRAVVITAAMAQGTMLEPVRDTFPDRFFDVGICESHAVIFAAGLAKSGLHPIVAIYSTFLQRGYDQIFQEISLQNLPVTFLLDRAGLAATDGPTHHGMFDIAYLRPFPNMTLLTPGDALDVRPMVEFATAFDGPTAIRYPKCKAPLISRNVEPIALGKAECLREGADGIILVGGGLVDLAMEAAKELGKNLDGLGRVDLGVLNARFIKPLDLETLLEPLRSGKFMITIEEGVLAGGFGSAVLESAHENGIDTRLLYRMGLGDTYIEHAERLEQLAEAGLTVSELMKHSRELQKRRNSL